MILTKKAIVQVMKVDPSRVTFERRSRKSKYGEFLQSVFCDGILQRKVIRCNICQKILCHSLNSNDNMTRHFKQHNLKKIKSARSKIEIEWSSSGNEDGEHFSHDSLECHSNHSHLSKAQKMNLKSLKFVMPRRQYKDEHNSHNKNLKSLKLVMPRRLYKDEDLAPPSV